MSGDELDQTDDRESRRIPLQRQVILDFDNFRGFIAEYSKNVSIGGMFIKSDSPKDAGEVFRFEFRLADGFRLIQGRGQVMWKRDVDEGPGKPAGMGVRFLEVDDSSRQLIGRVVGEFEKTGGRRVDFLPDETGQLAVAASEEIDPTVAAAEPESESVASEPATPPPLPAPDLTPPAIDRDFVPVQGRAAKRRGHGRLVAGLVVVAVVVVGSLFYLFRDRGDDRLVAPQATTRSSPPSSLETVPEAGSSQSVGEGVGPAESAAGEKAESAAKEEETPDAVAPGPALFSGVDSIDWQRQGGELVVEVSADGAVRSVDYDIVRLERGPPRLLLRIRGVKRDFSQSTLAVRTPEVRQIRMGYHRLATGHEQHLVFDLGSDQVELIGLEDGGPVLRLHFRTGS